MNRAETFRIDPFLLPICAACGGPLSLSHLEPATAFEPEKRIFRCSKCNAEQPLGSPSDGSGPTGKMGPENS
jgi:hypothetical protein